MKKTRDIRSKNLAGAFIFLGFTYEKKINEYGNEVYQFERTSAFEQAFDDLHAMKMAINDPKNYGKSDKRWRLW